MNDDCKNLTILMGLESRKEKKMIQDFVKPVKLPLEIEGSRAEVFKKR